MQLVYPLVMPMRVMKGLMLLACLQVLPGQAYAAKAGPAPAHALIGNWYNADYGIYPDFAKLTLATDGTATITGVNGRRRSGDHKLEADGRLVIRIADDAQPPALRVIIDSVPLLEGERLQLQGRRKTFYFSRARWLKTEVEKAMERYRPAKAEAAPKPPAEPPPELQAAEPVVPLKPEVPTSAREKPPTPVVEPVQATEPEPEAEPEPAPRVIKRLWLRLQGEGSGPDGCSSAVVERIALAGWELVNSRAQADAIVDVRLSGIHYERSFWVGQYYKIYYHLTLRDAQTDAVLGEEEGAERASGDGMFEVCEDVAEDIADEVEDLIEDATDD